MRRPNNKIVVGIFVLALLWLFFCIALGLFNTVGNLSAIDAKKVADTSAFESPFGKNKAESIAKERRAYEGAPPFIPHEIDFEMASSGSDCLACHKNGGFVPKFGAFAPVSSHPHLENCRQCHVPQRSDDLFKDSDWRMPKEIHSPSKLLTPPAVYREPHQKVEQALSFRLKDRQSHMSYFPCSSCHDQSFKATKFDEAKRVAHFEIMTSHPSSLELGCVGCHDAQNYDQLKHFSGQAVSFNESYKICAQCHQGEFDDFKLGIHGKRTNGWQGAGEAMTCTACHNPHSPGFAKRMPATKRHKGGKND